MFGLRKMNGMANTPQAWTLAAAEEDVLGFGEIPYNQAQKMIPELESAANNLFGKMKLERVGQWSGYKNAKFYIGEGKMMITQQDGTFITTINKTSNAWFQKATPIK